MFAPQFQCAYDEALLSSDGNSVIDRRMNSVFGTGSLRFAFYLRFYDAEHPLEWTYGEVECPPLNRPYATPSSRAIPRLQLVSTVASAARHLAPGFLRI